MPRSTALLAAVLLASCAPVIETTYTLVPPADAEGRACVARCQAEHAPCAQSCQRRERQCLADADARSLRDYQQELGDPWGRRSAGVGHTYVDTAERYRRLCTVGGCRDRCDATYRGCFERCGGTVTATDACTANCGP